MPGRLRTVLRRWWLWLSLAGLIVVGLWLMSGTGIRLSGGRSAEIEVLDVRFDPLSAGKNTLHLTVFNLPHDTESAVAFSYSGPPPPKSLRVSDSANGRWFRKASLSTAEGRLTA